MNRMQITFIITLILATLIQGPANAAAAPSFALHKFGETKTVKLDDFAGQIVLLDFFAYWCGPCQRSTPDIEKEIHQYYQSPERNPTGVKVAVISINVEEEGVAQTEAFIKRHRPSLVLNDEKGRTLEAYGGQGLPYLVVLDGTKSRPGSPKFEVVYRKAGYEGAAALRKVIDGVARKSSSGSKP